MFVKYRQGTLWLMRTHRATGGNYLVVHYSNGWTSAFLLFLGVLQGYIWCVRLTLTCSAAWLTRLADTGRRSSIIRGNGSRILISGEWWSGSPDGRRSGSLRGAFACRVSPFFQCSRVPVRDLIVSCADILHLDSSGRPARSFYAQAWFVNVGAIVVPSVAAVIIAVLAWQAHRRYWNSLEAYKAIDAALAS